MALRLRGAWLPAGRPLSYYVRLIALLYVIYLIAYFSLYAMSSYRLLQDRQRSTACSAAVYLESVMNSVSQITSTLQNSATVNKIMYAPLTAGADAYAQAYGEINKQVAQYDLLAGCYLYSRSAGIVLSSDEGKYDFEQFYDADFLREIARGEPLTVRVHRPPLRVLRSVQEEMLTVTSRFSSVMRDNAGYLCINLSLDRLREGVGTLAGDDLGLVVTGKDGPLFTTWAEYPDEGEVYGAQQALSGYGLRVAALQYRSVFRRALLAGFFEGSALFFVFSALVGLLLAVLLASFQGTFRSMVLQLANLYKKEEAANAFSLGDLSALFGELVRDYHDFSTRLDETGQIVREKLLLDLLTGNIRDGEETGRLGRYMEIGFPHGRFIALCVCVEGRDGTQTPGETIASRALVRSLLERKGDPTLYTALDDDSNVAGIVNFGGGDAGAVREELEAMAEQARAALEEGGKLNVFFSFSLPVESLSGLPEAFARSKRNLCYRFVSGTGCVFDDGEDAAAGRLLADAAVQKALSAVEARVFGAVYDYQRELLETPGEPFALRRAALLALCGLILDRTARTGTPEAVGQCAEHIRRLAAAEAAGEAQTAFGAFVAQVSRMTASARAPGDMNEYIVKALEYIGASYARELTVGEIAEHLNLNPKYFSRLFKECTGSTIMQHLSQVRMEKAMELLARTGLTVREIGGMVGFDESRSFIRHFKKHTGLTPGEYRAQKAREAAPETSRA